MTTNTYIALTIAIAGSACASSGWGMYFKTGTFSVEKHELYQPGLDLNLNNFKTQPALNQSANFVGAGYDWSGLGNNAEGVQLFSLVSPVHIYSAWHHKLRNINNQFITRDEKVLSILTSPTIPNRQAASDLMVNNLSRAITPKDKVSVLRLLDISTSNYIGQPVFITGKRAGKSVAVAKSVVEYQNTPYYLGFTTAVGSPSNPTESYGEGGDSGSPLLVPYRGQLNLVGSLFYPSSVCSIVPLGNTGWNPTAAVNALLATDGYALRYTIYDVPTDSANTANRWTGAAGSSSFSTSSNWSAGVAPAARPVVFNGGTSNGQNTLTLSANADVRGMLFNSSTGPGFTFNGAGRILTVGSTGIRNEDTKTQTFNTTITLSNSQNWEAAYGALTFNNSINNAGFLLAIAGGKNTTINGAIGGAGGLAKDDTGTLFLNAPGSYSGTTFLHNGTISLGANNVIDSSSLLWFDANNPAKLNLNGKTQTFGEISSIRDGRGTIDLGSGGNLTTGGNNLSARYVGSIAGSGTVTKVGSGTWTLAGASTNSGSVVVQAGTLLANNTIGMASVRVMNGATLRGTGGFGGEATLDAGGTLAPGEAGVESLTFGGLTWNGGAKTIFDLNGTSSDLVDLGDGSFIKGEDGAFLFQFANTSASTAATFTLFTFGSTNFQASDFTYMTRSGTSLIGHFEVTPNSLQFVTGSYALGMVPEPSSSLVLTLAAGAMALRRRSRGR